LGKKAWGSERGSGIRGEGREYHERRGEGRFGG